jgi:pimeloyl-ACP methyl ester carboxylesterase
MKLQATASTGVLSLLSIITALSSSVAAHSQAEKHASFHHAKPESHLTARDIRQNYDGDKDNTEGEAHGDINAPKGSKFTSLPVGSDGEEIAAYWSEDPKNDEVKHAFIMIHGKLRDGDDYWTTMNNILQSAIDADYPGADDAAIVVAPQFFSEKLNSGQYNSNMMAWEDVNAWQAGDPASHPEGTKLTSFDALDALVEEFMDEDKYPSMKNITVVGHGGGGQLNVRYAMVAKTPSKGNAHIRYIHGDPSSAAYFTRNRAQKISSGEQLPTRDDCEYYNTWRYGFDEFYGTADGLKTAKEYFQQYISRDVVSIVGYDDTEEGGDQLCAALMQGGTKRRDRNLVWWQYVNTLARTNENVTGFPATFEDMPDYSDVSHNQISMRLTVVEDAGHDAEAVFSGKEGRASLFAVDVPVGWRPDGWQPAPAIKPNVAALPADRDATLKEATPQSTSASESASTRTATELSAVLAALAATTAAFF